MRRHFSCLSKYLLCSYQRGCVQEQQPQQPDLSLSKTELYDSDDEEAELTPPKYNMKNTIPFIPPITGGTVIKVYGDSIMIASTLPYPNSPIYRFYVRLHGIIVQNDTKKSQQALEKLILYKQITLQNMKTEKYGRILADVYLTKRHININKWMIDNNHAAVHHRRTKSQQSPKS